MTAVGGSIQSVSIDGRLFAVAADADADRFLGGYTNDVQSNGNGTARLIKERKPFEISGLTLECDNNRGDQEFLQDVADKLDFVVITVKHADRSVFEGKGTISDDFNYSTMNATCEVALKGPDRLNRQ